MFYFVYSKHLFSYFPIFYHHNPIISLPFLQFLYFNFMHWEHYGTYKDEMHTWSQFLNSLYRQLNRQFIVQVVFLTVCVWHSKSYRQHLSKLLYMPSILLLWKRCNSRPHPTAHCELSIMPRSYPSKILHINLDTCMTY